MVLSKNLYSRIVVILGLVQLIESLAFSIPLSYFPNYAISLGASVASIGLFTSSFMVAASIMSPKLGGLSDVHGRKKIMLIGLLGDVILGVLTGLVPSWQWLLVIRVLNGVFASAAMLPAQALLIDSVSEFHRGEASGFVMSLSMIGRNIGPLFGGAIQWFGESKGLNLVDSYRIPYFVDAALALIAVLLVAWKVQEPEKHNAIQRLRSKGKIEKTPMSFSFKILLISGVANGIAMGFIIPIMALFYNDKFGIQPVQIGFILSITGFVGLGASWLAGRLSDRFGRKPLIALGGILSRAFGIILPLTEDINQAAGVQAVRSLSFNINMPSMRALLADLAPKESLGKTIGYFMTAFTSGSIIGPIIGTWLYSRFRYETFNVGGINIPGLGIPFFVNAIIGLVTTFMLLLFVKVPKKTSIDQLEVKVRP